MDVQEMLGEGLLSACVSRTQTSVLQGLGQRLNKQKVLISTCGEMRTFRICITGALLASLLFNGSFLVYCRFCRITVIVNVRLS